MGKDRDKICCHAMLVIDKETGESKRLCTYFSNSEEDRYEECVDEYCTACCGYKSRKEWRYELCEK